MKRFATSFPEVLHLILGIGIIFLSTVVFFPLRAVVGIEIIALLYLFPIAVISTLWGLRASLFSAIVAFFTLNYSFIPPYYTLYVHRAQDLVILLVFLAVSLFISQLVGRLRVSLQIARAREQEAGCLFDFMVLLADLQEEQTILDALTRQVSQAICAERVKATLQLENQKLISEFGTETETPITKEQPDLCLSMQVGKVSSGEICIWRGKRTLAEAEKRFLQIFISQASLALERLRLREAEIKNRVLAESDRLKASLLSSVSHELRTPLAAIKAAITGLNRSSVTLDQGTREELLKLIEEETDHLNLLVGNLLNMSRLEAGALTLERIWSNLDEIVQSAVNRIAPYLSGHRIVISSPPRLPSLYVDFLLMEQVMLNLLHNSIKHSPPHSTLEIIILPPESDFIKVEVRNQSPAIPPEYLGRIFDKFFRLEQPQRVQGTGLGLAICKGIIEAHGGKIWAENRSSGITFAFTLPLQNNQKVPPAVELKEDSL